MVTLEAPGSGRKGTNGTQAAIGALVPRHMRKAFRQFGFTRSEIVEKWPEIVGTMFATQCAPVQLRFAAGKRRDGTLEVLIEGAVAPHFSHVQDQVIERINRFFGYAAVARIRLRHGQLPPRKTALLSRPQPVLDDSARAQLDLLLRPVQDRDLQAALDALGTAILGRAGG